MTKQKDFFSKKHIQLLKIHSENLKQKYEEIFNRSVEAFKLETSALKLKIAKLSQELELAKQTILSSGTRRPVYSPGRYTDNG